MSGEPGADFLSEMDDDLRGCSKSCICDGVGLSPALELNKKPKKCAALVVSILMEMLDEGIDGLPKKVIKEYLHDYDDRFVHKGSLFRIVEKGLDLGMLNGIIVRRGRAHKYHYVSIEERKIQKEKELIKEQKKEAKRKRVLDQHALVQLEQGLEGEAAVPQKKKRKKKIKRRITRDPEVQLVRTVRYLWCEDEYETIQPQPLSAGDYPAADYFFVNSAGWGLSNEKQLYIKEMTESETKNQKRKRLKETAARCVPILQGDGKCTHWYEELYEEIHVAPQSPPVNYFFIKSGYRLMNGKRLYVKKIQE